MYFSPVYFIFFQPLVRQELSELRVVSQLLCLVATVVLYSGSLS